jgi:hypothetical protein
VIGHLGPRTSALLDGQLSPADEERAWEHVHGCHQCRDAVEREGWVKTRLATMQYAGSTVPSHLKGSLLFACVVGLEDLQGTEATRTRRHLGIAGISSGAVGAAVMGVLALGASPANAPGVIERPGPGTGNPFTSISTIVDRDRSAGQQRAVNERLRSHPLWTRTLAP